MINDEELTKKVLISCETNFSEEIIELLKINNEKMKLFSKYKKIKDYLKKTIKDESILEKEVSKAYIYAKLASNRFDEIKQKQSQETLEQVIKNYDVGYKFIVEANFLKIDAEKINNYVQSKIDGNIFCNKINNIVNIPIDEDKEETDYINQIIKLINEIEKNEKELKKLNEKILKRKINSEKEDFYKINYAV